MVLLEVYEKGEQAIITVCNCNVPSEVMLIEYKKLDKKIEDLPDEEKKELWDFANKNFPSKSKSEKINVCRIVHTIGTLL